MNFASAFVALVLERIAGYPPALYRSIGHPVEWMGALLAVIEQSLYRSTVSPLELRIRGLVTLILFVLVTGSMAVLIHLLLQWLPLPWLWEAVIATALIAHKSLRDHVRDVLLGLESSLPRGRQAVRKIVGRDPDSLDESGVAKAALESLAENAADGVVAPVFWFALAGLPGLVVYKAINTADSMIGHKSERYLAFGRAAARLDDFVNLPCSRLTGALFAAAAFMMSRERGRSSWNAMVRDAAKHQSPNAGWPEAALAGALDLRFGGPRSYDGHTIDLPTMGNGRGTLEANDIRRGLILYGRAMSLLAALILALALIL
ncbi:adenosylcobinamide-phosphate synthase CbiB [soil metagenome]